VTDQASAKRLEGIIPALAVPMQEGGAVDFSLLEKQVTYLCGGPIAGIFVGGTTGEGPYLFTEEKLQIFRSVKKLAPRGIALCAACIQPSTAQVVEEIHAFADEGPDFVVAVTPYYLGVSQEGILHHYRRIARESPVPVILYNIPQNTHNPIALSTIQELAGVDNVAGVKDSSGDFISFSRGVLGGAAGPFTWIQGEDLLEAPSYLLGARGVVTGLSNVSLEPYVRLRDAVQRGNLEEIRDGQRAIHRLFRLFEVVEGRGIPAIKAAMELLGRGSRHMRLSALTLGPDEVERIRTVLAGIGLLEGGSNDS
jgi:4-hydroxy-tetrahydrodipicolinate synthase